MKNNKLVTGILAGLFLLVLTGIVPTAVNAQQGRYANVYSRNQVKGYIDKLERSSNKFRNDFDRYMDQSNLNNTSTEDRFNGYVRDYAASLDRLKSQYSNSNNWYDNRGNVQQMISSAQPVNQMMNGLSFANRLENQWRNMRDDINKVADTFDMPGLNGGGWNGGGWNGNNGNNGNGGWNGNNGNGGWNGNNNGGNVPSWAIGTFYGRSQSGDNIVLSVAGNGSVMVSVNGGEATYATMNGTTLTNGPYVSRLKKLNNGFRTTSTTNNDYVDYYRNGDVNGNGNGGGWNGDNRGGNVPSWAVGTFYGQARSGDSIVLTVAQNGSVMVSVNGASATYATLNGTTLTNGPYVSRLTKLNNGFRTTSTTNNDYVDYYRNSNGNNNGNSGGWNGDNRGGNVPSWAVGTFSGRAQSGDDIVLTVAQNGSVMVSINGGNATYATMNGTTLTNGPYVSRVTKLNNGFRTTSVTSNEYVDYYRR